jgi:hypothetical protein
MRRVRVLVILVAFASCILLANAHTTFATDDPIERTMSATLRVLVGGQSATAFLVQLDPVEEGGSPRLVLVTAAHAFDSPDRLECKLVLRHRQEDGSYERSEFPVALRRDGEALWKKHPEHDVAALPIELPEGAEAVPFSLDQIADEQALTEKKVHVGQEVWVPCYPAGLEGNPAGWPVLRNGSIASYPLVPVSWAKLLAVDMTVFGGDSGAPVVAIVNDQPLISGMVIGMHRQTDKSTLPYEEKIMHTPMGVAIAVQAPFIRQTIDLLGK